MKGSSTSNRRSAIASAMLAVMLCTAVSAFASTRPTMRVGAGPLLDPLTQPKYVNPLPIPVRLDATVGGTYTVSMKQTTQDLGLVDPVTGLPLTTTVWGYEATGYPTLYPGPTFVAYKDVPVNVLWQNELVDEFGMPLQHLLPIDTTVHWALHHGYPEAGVPLVTHLHGGHTESASDGLPEAWFTPDFMMTGPDWVKALYTYDNDQEAGTIWYHDHALGITRLNVYAGLAGFYLIRDANEDALVAANSLPTGPYEIELAIQDRMFYVDGELYYPSMPPVPGAPDPSVLPEFFGDVILVNGKAWPVLDVEPRQYRFRFLNGSDSRFYNMWLPTPSGVNIPFYQIGTDDGLLNAPVMRNMLLLAPGERADVVVDFSNPAYAGQMFIMKNNAKTPYPMGAPPNPRATGQIMAFRVSLPLNGAYPMTTLPANLRPLHGPIMPLVQTGATRSLLLFEGMDAYGRMQPLLGTTADGMLMWDDPTTENPMLDDVEIWTVYNTTPDAHPVHLHLVAFQILDRQKFKATQDPMTGALTNIKLSGKPTLPGPEERGWKDTAIMLPGEVTRVIAKFDRLGEYVWHCHILSHEDHEMMRPYEVVPSAGPLVAMGSADGAAAGAGLTAFAASPNPFSSETAIRFQMPTAGRVDLAVFSIQGQHVRTLVSGTLDAGIHNTTWDGTDDNGRQVADGVYFYQYRTNDSVQMKKTVLMRQ